MKIVKNDLFDYKNRYIYQDKDGFKFSLDSILLAEYPYVKDNLKILDMCSGNAAIPLIISTKTKSNIVAFEIQEEIAALAKKSVELNGLENQIEVINDDVNNIANYFNKEYFDIIVCNPPYFKNNSSIHNKEEIKAIARHEIKINLEQIFKISFDYLKNNGILYMSHRADRLDEVINIATKYNLNVKELILVQTKNSDISMILVKCIKNSKNGIKIKVLDVSKCSTYQHIFER
ncbi:MAG TPA: methyltransferase [Candidatus Onthocola stercorigallinarum]|nr:methyltransferase [Candidatus Onthocola stercorigallinarum]